MTTSRTRARLGFLLPVFLVAALGLAAACGSSDSDDSGNGNGGNGDGGGEEEASGLPTEKLRNDKFCEIIATLADDETQVYSTFGFNRCPEKAWADVDEATVVEELEAESVRLDGPRYWVFDEIVGDVDLPEDTVKFGKLQFGLRNTFSGEVGTEVADAEPYTPVEVGLDVGLRYRLGDPVYILTSPEGDQYVMVSFSQAIDPSILNGELVDLGDKLTLPEGWTYTTYDLDEPYELEADDAAMAVSDDLGSTYIALQSEPSARGGSDGGSSTTVTTAPGATTATTAGPGTTATTAG